MCDMTHSYGWHDSFIYVTWLIDMCDMTHSHVWHDSFICVTRLIYLRFNSVPRLFHVWCVKFIPNHSSICVTQVWELPFPDTARNGNKRSRFSFFFFNNPYFWYQMRYMTCAYVWRVNMCDVFTCVTHLPFLKYSHNWKRTIEFFYFLV